MIYLLNATNRLDAYEHQIRTIVSDVLVQYEHIQHVGPLDVVVAENSSMAIPGRGLGGYTSTAHELYIPLDLNEGNVSANIDEYLALTMAHELSHVVRLQAGQPLASDGNLGDNIVAEGLADHLSLSLYPDRSVPWIDSLSDDDFERMKKRFLDEWQQKPYDHNAWFYGASYSDIPHWTGYSLGYALVKDYIESTNIAISNLLLTPTDTILQAWILGQKK